MRELLDITKALSDQTRLRVLGMLRQGELCVCQIIDVLGLAPSTVSKHMTLLHQAGLVEQSKRGKWHYYRLAERSQSAVVRQSLRWVLEALQEQSQTRKDQATTCCVQRVPLEKISRVYQLGSRLGEPRRRTNPS